jgi:hypothetical protein
MRSWPSRSAWPAVLGRRDDPALRVATYVGATSVVLSLTGFLRWVFVVPPLAHSYVTGDATTKAAAGAAWTAQPDPGAVRRRRQPTDSALVGVRHERGAAAPCHRAALEHSRRRQTSVLARATATGLLAALV